MFPVKVGNLSHTNTRAGVPIWTFLHPEVGSDTLKSEKRAFFVRFSRPGPGKDAQNRSESLEVRVCEGRNAHIPAFSGRFSIKPRFRSRTGFGPDAELPASRQRRRSCTLHIYFCYAGAIRAVVSIADVQV